MHFPSRLRTALLVLAAPGLFAGALLAALLVAGCGKPGKPPQTEKQNPMWSQYITAHTSGLVSRHATVRVVFATDVAERDQIGKSAAHLLDVDPGIDGKALFSGPREISLTPDKPLEPGAWYRVRVTPGKVMQLPKDLTRYEFAFQVVKPDLGVQVAGLNVAAADDGTMVLNGAVDTADAEDAQAVEKIVLARLDDRDLKTDWVHLEGGKRHEFKVAGIARTQQARIMKLTWNGQPIGVDKKGEQVVEVPAVTAFDVTQIQSLQKPSQHIAVAFSDNLDPHQSLEGLVETTQGIGSMRIEGSELKIFPEKRFTGQVTVTLNEGVRNSRGTRLGERVERAVTFTGEPPQVRFVGKGVILPENTVLSIPFEAVNVRSVQVTAFRIWEGNLGQFLQSNELDGQNELERVGRPIWTKTIHLPALKPDTKGRYSLDVTELLRENPGGMFRLNLFIARANSSFPCTGQGEEPAAAQARTQTGEELEETEGGDYSPDEDGGGYGWQHRDDPCKDAYYNYAQGVRDARNLLASNLGLLAKRDRRGTLHVVATNLRTGEPAKGVKLTLFDYQNQPGLTGTTDGSGFAEFKGSENAFYVLAEQGGGKGYLKLYSGSALPVSHFDVGGETVERGIKGFLYGERGVWRPGDDIHLTFVLQDKEGTIPANHPVTVTLHNPQGQLMQTVTNSKPTGGFYAFALKTDESAPTGNWTVKAQLGPNQFSQTLKIETVRPDRLKVELELPREVLYRSDMPFKGKIVAQWLHGAVAGGLKTDVALRLTPAATRFDKYKDYAFDDPARRLETESRVLLAGELDENGRLELEEDLLSDAGSPGAVRAQFTTRVFERGGAFSTVYNSATLYPYDQFVGVQMPKSERSWGMLPTDKTHTASIATVDAHGKPVSLKRVKVSLYRIGWRWWWDRTEDTLASFASGQHSEAVQEGEIATKNGVGQFNFEIRSPNWGRYLLRACDPDGGHCTGSVFYMDSPGWAAWAQEEGGAGASVLSFFSDKQEYQVGDTAVIQLPEANQGRALLTLENGTGLLEKRWIELSRDRTKFEVPITAAMSPNVYVSVALIQPHQGKDNDRPIRLYGVIPLRVQDPATALAPVVKTADEWRPESKVTVEVAEAKGREMTYTLAVVDEGLLTLTSYKTPDLRAHFYKREALGVTTWDLFDYVVGAYGGELERLLALGGDADSGKTAAAKEERRRFPPVVTFLGPFRLGAKGTAKHEIALPQYIGAVRVMVVAGERGAYGSADKTVPVRQPLSLLATLPRVLGPDEEVGLPVSLFVMDNSIKTVALKVEPDSHFEVVGKDSVQVAFAKPGEQLGMLKLKVKPYIGKATVRLVATSGQHASRAEVNIDVRSPNPRTVQLLTKALKPGETWSERVLPHGLPGTNEVSLEVYSVLPFRMEKHLDYLVQYPHGCLEQTTSSVFPQLYLPTLMTLEDWRKKEIERNIRAGVERLRLFQQPGGGFSYWPGQSGSYNGWASSYAGHFLVEAEQLGYFVPRQMILDWASQQKSMAQAWNGKGDWSELEQAYRLYTLALAKQPALGAMNRMREMPNLQPVARLQLAAAYKLAGQNEAAAQLAQSLKHEVSPYAEPGPTFGSPVRDKGIILSSLVALGDFDGATRIAKEVSEDLSADYWYSTQTLASALVGLGRMAGAPGRSAGFSFETTVGKAGTVKVSSDKPLYSEKLKHFPQGGEQIRLRNSSDKPIYAYVVMKGAPPAGQEQEGSEGLGVSVDYADADGAAIEVEKLTQSTDLVAKVTVTNRTSRWLENVALTHIVPSGWEIHNARLAPEETDANERIDYRDIRDDRVYTYFSIGAGQKRTFTLKLNAAYLGRYYLPSITVEPMYEATKFARTKGQWVEVVKGK